MLPGSIGDQTVADSRHDLLPPSETKIVLKINVQGVESFSDVEDFFSYLKAHFHNYADALDSYPDGLKEAAFFAADRNFGWFNVIMFRLHEIQRGRTIPTHELLRQFAETDDRVFHKDAIGTYAVDLGLDQSFVEQTMYGLLPLAIGEGEVDHDRAARLLDKTAVGNVKLFSRLREIRPPQDVRVAEALFEGLDGATSKSDGAVITFSLPDLKWSDGRPVKASDYRFAWRRCLDPSTGSPWAFRFRHIKNALAWHESLTDDVRLEMTPWDMRKPVIASVQGHCLGGGCEMVMLCDVTIAAEDTLFGEPEIRFSNVGPALVMPFIVGLKRARELLYLGDPIDARTALAWGMVNRVVPRAELETATMKLARRMALISPEALAATKLAINRGADAAGFRNALRAGLDVLAPLYAARTEVGVKFDEIKDKEGLGAALKWRAEQFRE